MHLFFRSDNRVKADRPFLSLLGLILLGMLVTLQVRPTQAAQPEPSPTPLPFDNPRMAKPVVPENPTLADKGAVVYWSICMACHGDKGQGLTDEFRSMAFGEDSNCWKSKCHAPNHPPEGFIFPRVVPAVVGAGTLQSYLTAVDLQKYIYVNMPRWKKGSLSLDQSWELTAFLLQQNDILPKTTDLNPKEAATISVHLPFHPRSNELIGQGILITSLGLLLVTLVFSGRLRAAASAQAPAGVKARSNFMQHLHPPMIPLPQARWRYTLGTGGLGIFLTMVLILTGTLEMFFYLPTPDQAGQSIQVITFQIPFGSLVRGIHFWAAQALVILATIHLLRVIFTGAYSPPRRFNYLLGVAIYILVIFFDFTGYVLRWDEGIRWALMVCTNLLKTIPQIGEQLYGFVVGGNQPGSATLIRFYSWHTFGLSLITLIFIVWHIFRIRRDGGIASPPPDKRSDPSRITRQQLFQREVLAMVVASIVLVLFGSLLPTPLAVPIRENNIVQVDNVRAPWFFLWVQYLLRLGDAFWLGVVLPLSILVILVTLPYIFPRVPSDQLGGWFPRAGRGAQIAAACLVIFLVVLTLLELYQ